MELDYKTLLQRGRDKLPKQTAKDTRCEVPKAMGHIQGNKTVINNFHSIATALGRPIDHLMKVVLKELATPGELSKSGFIIGTKVPASRINDKIQQYVREYVLCPECAKPDTKLLREDKILFIKCTACGAKHVVKGK